MTLRNKITPDNRRILLKAILSNKGFAKIIEVHNGISGIIGNDIKIESNKGILEFDGMWISSFTDSSAKGHPDAEIISFDSRLNTINEICAVTNKPIILDGDTGGSLESFEYAVSKLEKAGVSAVIIEDKVFPKRNSLDKDAKQDLEDPKKFANKIRRAKKVLISDDFMIIARLESLIAGFGQEDAIKRAKEYLLAGADGIMIHSKSKSPKDILNFSKNYEELCKELGFRKPLVCVPTTYNTITDEELKINGFNIVIHANHLLRSAHKSMKNTAKMILVNNRSFETDAYCSQVKEVFDDVGFDDIKRKDKEEQEKNKIPVIIPAAGVHPDLNIEEPCCMLEINGKTILERQTEVLKKFNLKNILIIKGYEKEKINLPELKYYTNPEDDKFDSALHSLMRAEEDMKNGFILIFSDIFFNEEIINKLLNTKEDIVLVGDNSYQYHKHEIDKKLDLIVTKNKSSGFRDIKGEYDEAIMIGNDIKKEKANCEFVGIAKFSKEGAEALKKVYLDCKKNPEGKFHEKESFYKASVEDILQEMIERGFKISVLKIHKGWIEIHNQKDYKKACELIK